MTKYYLRQYLVAICDTLIAIGSFYAAYAAVIGYPHMLYRIPGLNEKAIAFTAISVICFYFFSVTRGSWRFVSIPELTALIKASVSATVLYTVAAFLVSRADNVPRSVPVLTALFLIAGLSTVRISYRLLVDGWDVHLFGRRRHYHRADRNVIICGLTEEAEGFIRTSQRVRSRQMAVVALIEDGKKSGPRSVQGVPVYHSLEALPTLVSRYAKNGVKITELVVAERQPSRQRLNELLELATSASLRVSRLPDVTQTASITPNSLWDLKPIELGDLLGRPEVKRDVDGVARLIKDKVVLATGAGGSIGSELCRQIAAFGPRRMIITDSSEFHIYLLDRGLREVFPKLDIVTRIVNVREAERVSAVFAECRPDVVFHAAALKHVPLVEENPLEGIKTNVLGTRNVADAALEYGVSTFVMISTDKAVNPTSIMGATKRAAEAYCQALDVISPKTTFKTVRFGNVLASNGSVVPRFQRQINTGGPVTVTHPHIVRYFMTIPEAVRLVLHASADALANQSRRGKIMVLNMGKPVRIVDLAERMIQLAGLRPRIDIDIKFTGLRPGEKLFEELFDPSEVQDEQEDDAFVVASPRVIDRALLHHTLTGLELAADREDAERAVSLLRHIVPEYKSQEQMQDMPAVSGG